jgi:hypothetical protein
MLPREVRAALGALREWVDASGFVRFYKYLASLNLYLASPHVVGRASAERIALFDAYIAGDFGHFAIGAAMLLDLPVLRDQLDDWQRRIADALLEGGLVREAGGALRMGRFQLISVHGLPLLVDARMNFGAGTHEAYAGVDSAALAYYIDVAHLAPDEPALDLGTGVGSVALLLANHTSRVVATDIGPEALELARMNIVLNRREDRIELRDEGFEATFARGERYRAIAFNPPYVAVPQELAAPLYAKGPDLDGLGWSRRFLDRFDELVAPGGTAYLVSQLAGSPEEPFFAEELRRRAETQRLCIELYIDARTDYRDGAGALAALGRFLHGRNPELSVEECTRRVEHLHRVQLGARSGHATVTAVRHATVVPPYCVVFNRYRKIGFGELPDP